MPFQSVPCSYYLFLLVPTCSYLFLTNYVKTTSDWLGRIIREENPAYAGLFVRQFFYNAQGQLWTETATGLADRLNEFDAMGNQMRSGLDMDGNGSLVLASTDRIDESEVTYQQSGTDWYRLTTHAAYLTDNSGTPTYSYEKERLNLPLNTLSETRSIDAGSNETVRTTTVNRASKLVTETVQVPGSTTPAVTITRNGLVQSASTNSVAAPAIFTSDGFGRQTGVTDPRTSTQTVITYDDDAFYASNRVASVTVGDQTVVHAYYLHAEVSPGLLKSRTVNGKVTYFDYDSRRQIAHKWGEAIYPTWTEYDAFGRLWKLHTYRNEAGWNAATWPASAGAGDVTTWNFQDSTGLLTSKTDAANKSVLYTYKPFGQMETRTWARSVPTTVTTTYSYNLAGEVEGVSYSDTTPAVTCVMGRSGNRTTVTDAAGTHTLTYSTLGQLQTDAIGENGILANVSVSAGYDALFRKATLDASIGGTALLPQQTFHYDPATGRVQDAGDGTVSGVYAYTANSDWLHTTTFKRGTTAVMTTTREPDTLDRLLSVTNSVSGQPTSGSSFTYRYDSRGLRDKLTLADNSYWNYGYDDRAQVTSGQRFWSDNTGVGGMRHGYTFDAIGNRTGTNTNGRNATYTPTALNQYVSRTVPGAVDVLGDATATATVTVNNQPTTRKDSYFSTTLTVDNAAAAAFPSVSIVGVKNNVGPASEDAVTTVAGNVFLPKTPEAFSYDDDGNLTGDGRWTYTWDAENQLTSVTSQPSAPAASKVKLVFDYDAGGRRLRKTVLKWSTVSNAYLQTGQLRFLYDGWNLIAEINAANAPVRTYLWGLDLSGTFGEAGGVSGLLAIFDQQASPAAKYFAGYDGNGNLTSLIDSATGALAASYFYGPFGELISRNGFFANVNAISFSSKYFDSETGLLYYGYRYLRDGRWLSRDPIAEDGGINLYSFVSNRVLSHFDVLGLYSAEEVRKELEKNYGDKMTFVLQKLDQNRHKFVIEDLWLRRFDGTKNGVYVDCEATTVQEAAEWAMDGLREWAGNGETTYFRNIARSRASSGPGAKDVPSSLGTTLGRVHELFDLQEIGDLIQGWDETHRSEKTDQRSSLANVGAGPHGGPAFRGGSAPGSDRARICRGRPLFSSHGLSVAGFARGAGRLACGLHAVPALGGARRLAAPVEKSPNRTFCPGTGAVRGFDDGARAAPCGRRSKKNGPTQALGRSRGGWTTKIHAATIDENCSVALHLTPGQAHDGRNFESLYDRLDPDNVLESAALDKGDDADRIRERLALDGIQPVIPPIRTRCKKLPYDKALYRERNRVERFFNKLKQFRRMATRYDKLQKTFAAALHLVAAFLIAKNS